VAAAFYRAPTHPRPSLVEAVADGECECVRGQEGGRGEERMMRFWDDLSEGLVVCGGTGDKLCDY
jgi:hypothetical protein